MYPPPYHTQNDEAALFAAIDAIRHATLITASAEGIDVAFTPFFLDRERRVLASHIAARNPQSAMLEGNRVDVVFHGPHAYISPRLNGNEDVPTWNYVNVHVGGTAHVIANEERKWQMMQDFVRIMERDNAAAYLDFYANHLRPKLRAITCFEVGIEKLVGRYKLGRNDPPELQKKTFAILQEETAPSLHDWLKTLAPAE